MWRANRRARAPVATQKQTSHSFAPALLPYTARMNRKQWEVAGLLFFSGLCALIYQTVWLRQFRLIFGASTFATGAVLAIFMGGLGIGSALLGKRADGEEKPLAFYARLELLIA